MQKAEGVGHSAESPGPALAPHQALVPESSRNTSPSEDQTSAFVSPPEDQTSIPQQNSQQKSHPSAQLQQIPASPSHASKATPSIRTSAWSRLRLDTWYPEILAWLGSTISLVGICVFLAVYDGRSLSEWHWRVSINAVISTLALVSKALLLLPTASCIGQCKWIVTSDSASNAVDLEIVDGASRGLEGSLRILFKPSLWGLVVAGASITILAVATEPFVQQSVTYPLRPVNLTTASIPTAQAFTAFQYSDHIFDVTNDLKGAFYSALYSGGVSNASVVAAARCSTGNCTFPEYTSLTLCSQCTNVTSLMTSNITDASNVSFSLPNGASYSSGAGGGLGVVAFLPRNNEALNRIGGVALNLSAVWVGVWPEVTAWDCIVSFCLRTYDAKFSSGQFQEHLRSTFIPTPAQFRLSDDDFNHQLTLPSPNDRSGATETFNISSEGLPTFGGWLGNILQGQVSFFLGVGSTPLSNRTSDTIYDFFTNLVTPMQGLDQPLELIVSSLSNAIRVSAMQGNSVGVAETGAIGTAWRSESYIKVRYQWLTLSFVLTAASLLFLLLTMWQTRRRKLPIWKSSLLMAMTRAGDVAVNHDLSAAESLSALGVIGKRKMVALEPDEYKFRIVKSE